MSELSIIKKSIRDYFTSDMLKILLVPLFVSVFVLYIAFFNVASTGLESLTNVQVEIEQRSSNMENGVLVQNESHETYAGSGVVEFLLQYAITSWIVSFLVYFVGIFAIGYLSIFISLIVIGFLTPKILSIVHRKHYSDIEVKDGYGTIAGGVIKLIKTIMITIILFFVLIPFYFIPIVNIIAINFPIFYFFHKMLHFDVSSTLLNKNDADKLYYFNKATFRVKSLCLYMLALIPFVAFFISTFYIIYLGHSYFNLMEKSSLDENNI